MTKLIKNIVGVFLVACMLILAWKFLIPSIPNPFKIKKVESSHSLILKEIRTMGNLELASYFFNDIVEQRLSRDFLPDPKALLIVYGSASGCIDLTKIMDEDIRIETDTTYIHLPEPYICHFKVDHSKSKIYHSEYAFMNEDLLFEEAYKSAERKILETAEASDLLKTTSENANKFLIPLLEKISGKPVVAI